MGWEAIVSKNTDIHSFEDIDTATDFELKHTPGAVLEGKLLRVSIGLKGIAHPQTEEHYIEWIKVFDGDELVGEALFGPDEEPVAAFEVERATAVQALCNLHGIWQAKL